MTVPLWYMAAFAAAVIIITFAVWFEGSPLDFVIYTIGCGVGLGLGVVLSGVFHKSRRR